jgi:dienelactone hydrolase
MEMDWYVPPAVLIVGGYPGRINTLDPIKAWARRIADAGMLAAAYANEDPVADVRKAVDELRTRADRIALFAMSGNVPVALSALDGVCCAALLYGFMLDNPETSFGFADPKTRFEDVPRDVPLLVIRAGRDQFDGINESIDRFVAQSLAHNLPITLINQPDAQHASESEELIEATLRFLRAHLLDSDTAPRTSSSARS